MSLKVAIVGSGPSGFYTADALVRADADVDIDIIERLPAPYGLIRGGVAPDHQTTKNVSRNFERTALKDSVAYFGNVEIGRDLTLGELRALYDAVVLAIGAPNDRPLGIPGDDRRGVIGSAAFVGWYNGHPDFRDLDPPLDHETAVVIGNGNVAVDVARILSKTTAELESTDIADYAIDALANSAVRDIYMVGRRGPAEAKFTNVELRELGTLEDCIPVVDAAQLPDEISSDTNDRDSRVRQKNLGTLHEFAAMTADGRRKRLHILFYASPVEVLGSDRVTALKLERTTVDDNGRAKGSGEFFEIECGLVAPAIGYRSAPISGVPFDERMGIVENQGGRVAPGLYVVGWVKRGPTGVIATNRPDGREAADQVVADLEPSDKPGREGLRATLDKRGVRYVDFADWKRIDDAETAAALNDAPRRKFTTVADMMAVLDDPEAPVARKTAEEQRSEGENA